MIAQVDRTQAPRPGPAPEVHLGSHQSFTLPNGMRVIIVENHKIPIVSAQVRFDIPPVLQGDKTGYQDLVGELLTAGTTERSKARIDEFVDGMGAKLIGSGDGVYASCLTKNFPQMLDLMREVVVSATYPEEEFNKAKTRSVSQIGARADDPDQIADVVGQAITFGKDRPYGEVPSDKTMAQVSRDDVYAYYRYFFQPAHGYLVLVGDITVKDGKAMAEKAFGEWKGAQVPVTKDAHGHDVVAGLGAIIPADQAPVPPGPLRVAFVDRPGSAQSVIKVVFPVDLKPNDPMALQAQVLNTILGGGVFNARLMQNLREDKGYTYGAYSSLDADRWVGSFSAGCSVRNEVTDSAVTQIMNEIRGMRNAPVKEDELALAKSNMAGSFARSLEDPRTVARFALNTFLNALPPNHYETYLERLDAVSIADVQKAADRFLHPDHATILVVGDKAQVENSLKDQTPSGTVLQFDINGDPVRGVALQPAPDGVTAQTVLDAYVKAIGGKAALAKVKDLKREYTTTVQGMSATMVEYNKAPNFYAMEMKMGAMVLQKQVYDGKKGKSIGMDGEKPMEAGELAETRASSYAFPELHYAELGYAPVLMGITEVDGRSAYQVQVTSPTGRFDEFYEQGSGLKLRRVQAATSEDGNTVTVDYSDYKPEGGILFPNTIRQQMGMDLVFKSTAISVNKGIDAAMFTVE